MPFSFVSWRLMTVPIASGAKCLASARMLSTVADLKGELTNAKCASLTLSSGLLHSTGICAAP